MELEDLILYQKNKVKAFNVSKNFCHNGNWRVSHILSLWFRYLA